MSTRAYVVLASCIALATIVVVAARIGSTRVDRAVGPIAIAIGSPPISTADTPERSPRTPIVPRCRIDGTVVDVHGTPIDPRDGSVELRGPGDALVLSTWGPDGSFAFEALSPGHWTVRVLAPNRAEGVARVDLSAPDGTGRADLVLQRVRNVTVRIVDENGTALAVTLAANGLEAEHAGRIEIDTDSPGSVVRSARGYLDVGGPSIELIEGSTPRVRLLVGNALLDEVHPKDEAPEIVLTANIERIRAQAAWITFELPEPLPRSTVVEYTPERDEKREIRLARDERAARIGVGPGPIDLRIAAEGYREIRRSLRVAPGETRGLGVLALEPECILRGVVRNLDGQPLGAPILVRGVDQPDREAWLVRATADVNGRFLVRGLGKGSWIAWCEWGGPTEFVELPRAADLELVGEFPAPDRPRQGRR